jgi:hypothetical protein
MSGNLDVPWIKSDINGVVEGKNKKYLFKNNFVQILL